MSSEPGGSASGAGPWWHDAVGYAIYLPSFADSDGDGRGDLTGVVDHLDHLVALGVDLLWVTPFHPSPGADNGYDITDYCAVDPAYGELDTVRRLCVAAHGRDIRVVIDLVPNHTSDRHPWFEAARSDPAGPYRGYYVWRDPAPDGGPPNNWVSCFGGSAWTLDPVSGRYYLHLFLAEQPDLDWRNPAVIAEFDRILTFWLAQGIDGFRIDVAQGLVKDALLRSNPELAPYDPAAPRRRQWASFEHRHDIVQPETLEIFRRWRQLCERHGAVLIGETSVLDTEQYGRLLPGDGLHLGFWFGLMDVAWDAAAIGRALRSPLAAVTDPALVAWQASSLDEERAATRFGGGEHGRRRAMALATVLCCLPGVPFLYQGEELALLQGVVAGEHRSDPVGGDVTESRDGCRTPMPWAPGPNLGFTTAARPWLPETGRTDADTVAAQRGVAGSWFERYRSLIALRRSTPALRQGPLRWLDTGDAPLVAFERGEYLVVLHCGNTPTTLHAVAVPVGTLAGATVVFDSERGAVTTPSSPDAIGPDQALIIRRVHPDPVGP